MRANIISMLKYLIISVLLISFWGCNKNTNNVNNPPGNKVKLHYAKGFSITQYEGYKVVSVFNPWQNSSEKKVDYYLYPDSAELNNSTPDCRKIQIPVKRVVVFSATHVAFIQLIEQTQSIVAASGAQYIYNKIIKQKMQSGTFPEIGYEQSINYELLLTLKPDVVFVFSVSEGNVSYIDKMEQLGIPVVYVAEYLEEHPLGKAEWCKMIASFYDMEPIAAQKFDSIQFLYNQLKDSCLSLSPKPKIVLNLPYNGIWYLPGGESYMAQIIADAGGDYLWKNIQGRESFPVSYEEIYAKGINADIWLHPGTVTSVSSIKQTDSRLTAFKSIKKFQVYNNIAKTDISGGNEFWETGTVNPYLILSDLASIFYPEKFKKTNYNLYVRLQ